MSSKCKICSEHFTSSELRITCASCLGPCHASCVNMTTEDIDYLNERNEPWNCSICLSNTRILRSNSGGSLSRRANPQAGIAESLNQINVTLNRIFAELASIKSTQATIAADVARCNSTIESHSNLIQKNADQIEDCSAKIVSVEASSAVVADNLSSLSDKVAGIENDLDSHKTRCQSEDFVREATERLRRSSNLIIRGLPENGSSDGGQSHDLTRTEEVLRVIDPTCVSSITSICRLGSSTDTPRPIKVCFDNSRVPAQLLRNKSKLLLSQFRKISLSDDKTPHQLRHLAELRQELRRRQERGESGCTIKYIKGVPSIVSSQHPKNQASDLESGPSCTRT